MPKLIPVPDEVSKPFWDAVNEKRLIVQNCTACADRQGRDVLQYPPSKECRNCGSDKGLEWRQLSGRGKIIGYIVVHDSRQRVYQEIQPFNLAVVAPDEDPTINFMAHLPGTPVDEVPVGGAVEVCFEEAAPGRLVHDWKVVK